MIARRATLALLVGLAVSAHSGDAVAQDVEAGRRLYVRQCAMCHGSQAEGMAGMHPALQGAVARLTREGVEVTIRNGRDTMPPMPAFGDRLSDDEITDVTAYLTSLPHGPRNFGPEADGMMRGPGMMPGMDRMSSAVPWLLLSLLAALLAGVVGYLLGRSRGRPPTV